MNSIQEYNDITAFHPGYYIAEIIEDMGISQAEFAIRMGTTPKTISMLVNGKCNLSNDLAQKVATMVGGNVEIWLNLQKAYDERIIEIEHEKAIEQQSQIMQMIDYSYFVRVAHLPAARNIKDKITNLCGYLMISDLRILLKRDFLVNYRSGISTIQDKNVINAQAWLQTAINFARHMDVDHFSAEDLRSCISSIRNMTVQTPDEFLPKLKRVFADCGVMFVMLPHLKNSGINGAVKWLSPNHVILAINDRRCYADTFWFSLFHEIRHVLQQKIKTVFISSDSADLSSVNSVLEKDADDFAKNTLVPAKDYAAWSPTPYTSDAEIVAFANSIGIHPGIVAGRLQHDGIILPNRCAKLKQKYKIVLTQ